MYNSALSLLMAQMSELTYVQYKNGPPPANNGNVQMPTGYTQISSFTAPEFDLKANLPLLSNLSWENIASSNEVQSQLKYFKDVYFGFAATSANYNVIALRGTQSDFEWLIDTNIPQVPVPLVWYNGKFNVAKVHLGFLIFFVLLAEQIIAAAKQFDNKLPCLITGHSLGAALATLAAPAINILTNNTIQMYNFASPRVGNKAFAEACNFHMSESYRVVNLSDMIPMLPPSKIFSWEYAHVTTEWSFLNQSGNVAGNHALIGPDNYTDAVKNNVPTDARRTYPVSGLG